MERALRCEYEIYIRAPRDRVWQGLVDGDLTRQYVYGTRLEGSLEHGAPYAYVGEGGFAVVDGTLLEVEPGKRLGMTWQAHWDDEVARDRASRVTYEIAAAGTHTTKLTVRHDDFDGETATYRGSVDSWPRMLSSLKSLLETGTALESG